MKIVRFRAGLGNQMFQYAFGQLIEADAYDISWYTEIKPEDTPRMYELGFFSCTPRILSDKETIKYIKNNKFLKKIGIRTSMKKISEKPFNVYNEELLKTKKGVFQGYFQCAQYCDAIRPQLLKDFTPAQAIDKANREILDLINQTNSVSLHVRRGDYLKLQDIYNVCDLEYYKKAIDYISQITPQPHFFLFSDDVDWVKDNLKIEYPFTVVDINHKDKSPWDIWLMKHCKHNIIANSSFSWWGAWLNENQNKVIIAPQHWLANGDKTDIIPQNWKRL